MKKKKVLQLIALFMCVVAMTYCVFHLVQYDSENAQQESIFSELDKYSGVQTAVEKEQSQPVNSPKQTQAATAAPHRDILALQERNGDCIGWLSIADTDISYPLMQKKSDPDYYLHTDFYGDVSAHGVPYLDGRCDQFDSDLLIAYGHHMMDGSMFSQLHSYKEKSFAESYREITLETEKSTDTYTVFAVLLVKGTYQKGEQNLYQSTEFQDEDDFLEFLRYIQKESLYVMGEDPTYGDQLLLLSTCEYSQANGRLVVIAQKI